MIGMIKRNLFWISLLCIILLWIVMFIAKLSGAEELDSRHQLCVDGKLPLLHISREMDLKYFNPVTEELHRAERPFYAETMQGGKKVAGCAPVGIYVSAKKGNIYAEHFAVKGWRDIMNTVPISLIAGQSVPVQEKKIDLSLPSATREGMERQQAREDFLKEPSKALGVALTAGNCASAIAVGWGVSSKNETAGMVGVSMLVIEYAVDYAYGNGISFGDVLTTAVCGAVGAVVAPKSKDDEQKSTSGGGSGGGGGGGGSGGGGPTNPPN